MQPSRANPLPAFFALLGYAVSSGVIIAALFELGSWLGWSMYDRVRPSFPELRKASPVYQGEGWAAEYWREEFARQRSRQTYAPFKLWTATSWHSTYINNDRSESGTWRRTMNPPSSDCVSRRIRTVWVLGGSTVYGTGVPDWATLPSYLAHALNAAGSDCWMVTNLGIEGYVSNQELLQLFEQLKTNRQPEIVVFYDGVNDAAAAGAGPGPPEAHFYYGTIKNRVEGSMSGRLDFIRQSYAMRTIISLLRSWHRQRGSVIPAEQSRAKVLATLNNYEENVRIAKALSESLNFELFWFWQPSLYYGHKPVVPFEQQVFEVNGSEENKRWSKVIAQVYQEAETRAKIGDFVFLGGLFDSVHEPLYLDEAHLGPRGNEIAANFIADYIMKHSKESRAQVSETKVRRDALPPCGWEDPSGKPRPVAAAFGVPAPRQPQPGDYLPAPNN